MPTHYAEQEEAYYMKQKQKEEMKETLMGIEIDLPEKDLLKLSLIAHEKNITLNDLIADIMKRGIKDGEYRFEHDKRPQLLNESE